MNRMCCFLSYFAVIFLTLFIHPSDALYDVTRYCHLVPIGTKLPSFDSCQTYYTCHPNGYTKHNCDSEESFDKDTQSCKPSSWVNCFYNLRNPCSQSDANFLPNSQNCKGFISCINGKEIGRGNCPNGQIFDANRQICKYGKCKDEIGSNANGDLEDECRIMQVDQYFGDFKRCRTWKLCTSEGKLIERNCGKGLVFDSQSRMCLKDDGQMCVRLEVPSSTCEAQAKGVFKPDTYICSDYYACNGITWQKYSCPIGEYFDIIWNTCKPRQLATPVVSCNRCQYATVKWANAVDPQCANYYECSDDGRMIREGTCDADAYFHEARQICIMGATDLNEYRKLNGACFASDSSTENSNGSGDTSSITTDSQTTSQDITTTSTNSPSQSTTAEVTTSTPSTSQSTTSASSSPATMTSSKSSPAGITATTSSSQDKCQINEKGSFKTEPLVCSVFYLCDGHFWIRHECHQSQYFDTLLNQCIDRLAATPTPGCDRCQYATGQWANSVDPECSKYLVCQDGHKVAESTCGSKGYFDEKRQSCVVGALSLVSYRQKSGACKGKA